MQEESEIILHASYRPVIVSSESVQNRNEVSAILGGDSIYLRDGEDWPNCPTCSCALLPILHLKLLSPNLPQEFRPLFSHHEESSAPILQFLICSDSECFETTVIQEESAWLMRIISSAAADILCVNPSGSSLLSDRSIALDHPAVKENWKDIHKYLSESALFKPQTVITRWNQAKREMVDYEDLSFIPDVSDEFFEEHKPLEGVKLLGYPIKGKFKGGNWGYGCPVDEEGCKWRCIIQLGPSRLEEEDIELLETSGNCRIMQYEKHHDRLALGLNGDW